MQQETIYYYLDLIEELAKPSLANGSYLQFLFNKIAASDIEFEEMTIRQFILLATDARNEYLSVMVKPS